MITWVNISLSFQQPAVRYRLTLSHMDYASESIIGKYIYTYEKYFDISERQISMFIYA